MELLQKVKKFIIWLGSGLVLTLIGNSIYDNIKGINLLKRAFDCLWNQLNVFTIFLLVIILVLVVIFIIKKARDNKSMTTGEFYKAFNESNEVDDIVNEFRRKKLFKDFLKVVVNIQNGCGDFTGFDLNPYLLKGLIVRTTKSGARGFNFYALTELGNEVWKKLR